MGLLVKTVTLTGGLSSVLTLALGTLPDSFLSRPPGPLLTPWTSLDSLSHSGLIGFLHIRCGLPAPVSGKKDALVSVPGHMGA